MEKPIGRVAQLSRLRPFLQYVLGVPQIATNFIEQRRPVLQHKGPRHLNATIKIESGDKGLAGIAQDGRLSPTAGAVLGRSHKDGRIQAGTHGNARAGLLPDEGIELERKRTFIRRRKVTEKQVGDQDAQHAITQKLEPLVVGALRAAVGQREAKQVRILEGMPE